MRRRNGQPSRACRPLSKFRRGTGSGAIGDFSIVCRSEQFVKPDIESTRLNSGSVTLPREATRPAKTPGRRAETGVARKPRTRVRSTPTSVSTPSSGRLVRNLAVLPRWRRPGRWAAAAHRILWASPVDNPTSRPLSPRCLVALDGVRRCGSLWSTMAPTRTVRARSAPGATGWSAG